MTFCKNILLLSFLLIGLNSFAQTSTQYGDLEVKVIDSISKKPLKSALVSIQIKNKKYFKYSDINGICEFKNISFGKHILNISLNEYCNKKRSVNILSRKHNKTFKIIDLSDSPLCHCIKSIHKFQCGGININLSDSFLIKIIDSKNHSPFEYAKVTIQSKRFKTSRFSNKNGEVVFDSLPAGTYNIITSCPGYTKVILENVILKSNTITKRTIALETTTMICNPVINHDKKPIIKPDEPTQHYLNRQQIMRMPY